MTLAKREFVALADRLRALRPDPYVEGSDPEADGAMSQWLATVRVLADYFQAESPRFDRLRWLAYVGGDESSR